MLKSCVTRDVFIAPLISPKTTLRIFPLAESSDVNGTQQSGLNALSSTKLLFYPLLFVSLAALSFQVVLNSYYYLSPGITTLIDPLFCASTLSSPPSSRRSTTPAMLPFYPPRSEELLAVTELPPREDTSHEEGMNIFSPRPRPAFPVLRSALSKPPTAQPCDDAERFPVICTANESSSGKTLSATADFDVDEQNIAKIVSLVLPADPPALPSRTPIVPPRRPLSPLNRAETNYKRIKQLGTGGEGTCTLVEHRRTHQVYALKIVSDPELVDNVPREAAMLDALKLNHTRHCFIISMAAYVYNKQPGISYAEYYLPYFPLGDLHSLIRAYATRKANVPELFIWKVFHQAASVLEFLHQGFYDKKLTTNPGLVHRDIKPENILLRATSTPTNPSSSSTAINNLIPLPDIVISDFGHAVLEEFTYSEAGTSIFRGPEIPRSSPKGDVWGLGASIHSMIHGIPPIAPLPQHIPPTKENYKSWHMKREARRPNFDLPSVYSDDLADTLAFTLREEGVRPVASLLRKLIVYGQLIAKMEKLGSQQGLHKLAFECFQ